MGKFRVPQRAFGRWRLPLPGTSNVRTIVTLLDRVRISRAGLLRSVVAAVLLTLLAGAGTAIAMDKSVTVQVDGQSTSVSTMSATVDGALHAAGVQVGEHDTLAPSAATPIAAGDTIVLRRGRHVELTIDGQQRSVWTTALTVQDALAELGMTSPDAQLSASRSSRLPLEGAALDVSNPHDVTIVDAGVTHPIRTTAATVGALLTERGMVLQQADTVSADVAAPVADGMQLMITRIRTADITTDVPVPAPVQKVDDPTQAAGQTTVQTKPADGKQAVTFRVTTTNGAETSREQVSVTVTTPPTPGVTLVGTKAPVPAVSVPAVSVPAVTEPAVSVPAVSEPTAAASGNTGASAPAVANASAFDALAGCESGGNWAINTGNGFYGGVQFDRGTWLSNGGGAYAPLPNQASREQQIAIASKVQAARVWSPWPSCSSKLGLR